jgi:hypothetical protein
MPAPDRQAQTKTEPEGSDDDDSPRRGALVRPSGWLPRLRAAQLFLAFAGGGLLVRLWQTVGRGHLGWADSQDYLDSSRAPWFGLELWAGQRPVAVPLVLRLVAQDETRFVQVQVVVAALCWAALALSVASLLRAGWRRGVGVGAVVALSLAPPVTMWDRSVLSESFSMSMLALVAAVGLQLIRWVTPLRAASMLAVLVLWVATRDTHAAVVGLGAVTFGGWALGRWVVAERFPGGRPAAVLAGGAFALALLATLAATHGQRHLFPLGNVYAVRILPYADRVEWFSDHGMPQAEVFVDPEVEGARPPVAEPEQAPVTWVGEDDPVLQQWRRWLQRDGRATFARWAITHPDYVLVEPWRNPERAFNNAEGDRSFYAALDRREVPLVGSLVMPPRLVGLAAGAAAAIWVVWRRQARSPLFVVGAATLLLAAPHALLAWHSDGMETARHLAVPVFQFHLGVLLLVLAALGPARQVTDAAS